jgi:DNA-binding response OmpR family regulator
LIVDVDQDVGIFLQDVLKQNGYSVLLAHDGRDAITAARKTSYDILLIDLMLPKLNGLETYLAIQEINPKIVTIVLTTRSQDVAELAEQALTQNAYTCLDKPIDINHLLDLLCEIEAKNRIFKTLCSFIKVQV